jgi:hypothetical protein
LLVTNINDGRDNNSAKHNVVAAAEERPMTAEGANEAFAKIANNTARYRMVLVDQAKAKAAAHSTAGAHTTHNHSH